VSFVGVGGRKEADEKGSEQWIVGDARSLSSEVCWRGEVEAVGLSDISRMTVWCGAGWRSEGSDINGPMMMRQAVG